MKSKMAPSLCLSPSANGILASISPEFPGNVGTDLRDGLLQLRLSKGPPLLLQPERQQEHTVYKDPIMQGSPVQKENMHYAVAIDSCKPEPSKIARA